jgi:hypothetical protein
MGLSNREYVGRALETLATSLGSYIATVLEGVAPGISWPKILEHKDASAGRTPMTYSPTDLSVQLRVLTESLGSLGYSFNLGHDVRSYTSELPQTRNLWAHNETFDDADTFLDQPSGLESAGRGSSVLKTIPSLSRARSESVSPASKSRRRLARTGLLGRPGRPRTLLRQTLPDFGEHAGAELHQAVGKLACRPYRSSQLVVIGYSQ